ncbi:MAG TPA: protein kinase, partial [Blastocatellia bacterium]|nr:protein kinase [Blastocatellia bacterium]
MTPLSPGKTLSHYRIIEQLGQGGQATAYKAEDTRLNRLVVVKTLLPELAASQTARRRFEREAKLASVLDHPNICSIFDIGESEGWFYIVMPFIPGRTLKQVVAGQPLELRSALSIAIQIADALVAAHARGIIHRDIKPSNIIVNDQGQVKVLDFGLAKMLGGDEVYDPDKSMTELGVPYGTMGYGSPEQAAGERVDHRTDVFSLGVLLYEMVTGHQPFTGRHRIEILHAVINAEPDPICDDCPTAPDHLQAIIDHALAKNPKDRFSTMADMFEELKAQMRELTGEAASAYDLGSNAVAPQRARTSWKLGGALGKVFGGGGFFGRKRNGQTGNSQAPPKQPYQPTPEPPSSSQSASTQTSSSPNSLSNSAGATSRPRTWGTESKRTIAVLPFKNLSGNAEDNFYEISLADGLIAELAHLRSLVVRPSQYIARYAGQNIEPRQVGEELAVSTVLVGSFIKAANRFRVTTQLQTTESGEILWSDKIDLAADDLLKIQDTIAERVIAGLKLKLTDEEQQKLEKPLTNNTEAYEFYLRGRDLLFKYISHSFNDQDLDVAIKMLEEAVRLDPNFARAHYTLGRCLVHHGQGYGGQFYFDKAEASLMRALELDPKIAGARLQMVYVYLNKGEKEKALATLADARREAPHDPTVFIIAGMLYRLNGLYDRALKQYDKLLELNPRDVVIASYNRGRLYMYRHEYDRAIAELEKGRTAEPDHPLIKTFLAITYFNQGQIDRCQAITEEVLRQNPHFDPLQIVMAWCLSARGKRDEALALITDQVKETAAADHDVAVWLASLYAMENNRDQAIEWIKKAVALGNENYPLFADNNRFDNLRCDLRFVDLLNELKKKW